MGDNKLGVFLWQYTVYETIVEMRSKWEQFDQTGFIDILLLTYRCPINSNEDGAPMQANDIAGLIHVVESGEIYNLFATHLVVTEYIGG